MRKNLTLISLMLGVMLLIGISAVSASSGFCGDGYLNPLLSEQCDDGNTDDGDGCSANCVVEEGWECTDAPRQLSVCTQEETDCIITVNPPAEGKYYSDDVFIEWALSGDGCTSPTYNLHFNMDTCTPSNPTDWDEIIDSVNELEYDWTSGFDEAQVCVRVSEDEGEDFGTSGLFYIDNLDPIADANGKTCVCEGDCCDPVCDYDLYTCDEGEYITLDGSDSYDQGDFPSGIVSWEWYVDGEYVGEGETFSYYCADGEQTLPIELIVTDAVGNSDSDSESEIHILNVNPICEGIGISPGDYVVGFPLTFTGSATDVPADIPLDFFWDFGNSDTDTGESVIYTYDTADTYTVSLTVEDKDGGSDVCTTEVIVSEVIELDNQELAVCECLDADFGDANDGVDNSFDTDISGVSCSFVGDSPTGLTVSGNDDDCVVTWCGANEEQVGTHFLMVKAQGSETKYYSFYVTVYDYGIELHEGWNLISIPLVPEGDDTSIDSVFAGIYENIAYVDASTAVVLQYDAVDDKWFKARKYSSSTGFTWSSSSSELENIIPGYGYWIYMEEADTLYLNGEKMYNADSSSYPPSVTLGMDSWNLVGVYGLGKCCYTSVKISDALVSLTDEEDNAYYDIIYDEDGNSPSWNLKSKEGYWVSIKKVFAGDETIQYKANYNTFPGFWF